MSDLKGKRVSTGSPGSATEVMAFRVIEAAGLDKDKDMRRERLGVAESTNAIKDGKIDAFFWVGGLPTAAVTDLGATPGVKIKLIDHADVVDKMNAKYGGIYTTGVIPAKTYPGQDKDNKITVVQNILVANAKMSDKVAYDIVKTFIEKRDDLVAVHGEAENIELANQSPKNSPIPWHPGAVKYFTEKGVKMNDGVALAEACFQRGPHRIVQSSTFPDSWRFVSRRQLAAARMLAVFARAGARRFFRGAAGLLLLRRGFSGERRRRCREHFPLRRQPVLIGLTVRSAMCGPESRRHAR